MGGKKREETEDGIKGRQEGEGNQQEKVNKNRGIRKNERKGEGGGREDEHLQYILFAFVLVAYIQLFIFLNLISN